MAASVRSSDQFLCSICLEVFTEPVSTPCGHNFCKTCITQHWDNSAPCSCPLCNEVYHTRPKLKVNTLLLEMFSEFKQEEEKRAKQVSNPGCVPCDVCPDPKLKALRSCLVCLASFCETHLQPHLTVSGLKRHQLMEPVEDLEDRTCPKHHKPLELFCRTDQSCVCTMCPLLDHKNHEFVSLQEEYHLQRTSLHQTQAQTQLMVEQRRQKIREISRSLKLSQDAVNREGLMGLKIFTTLIEYFEGLQHKFIQELQDKHKQTQKQAQELISELEQEICELQKRGSEVDHLSRSEDHLHFIQKSTSLRSTDLKDLRDWSTVRFEPQTYEGSAERAFAELDTSLPQDTGELKTFISGLELLKDQQFAVDVTLDPDTAHPELVLSEDLQQVHHTGVRKDLPDNPERFSVNPCVLGKQSFSSGKFYFEVQVKGKTRWDLGVAQESINRKEQITLSPQKGYWAICLRYGHEYKACANRWTRLSLKCPPQKVGVFVDYSQGVVSFIDVDSADLIYSFTGCGFKEKLLPYFRPDNYKEGKNSTPLVITPVCEPDAEVSGAVSEETKRRGCLIS